VGVKEYLNKFDNELHCKQTWESKIDFILLQPQISKWGVKCEKVKLKGEN
jgi:hypothetical protein